MANADIFSGDFKNLVKYERLLKRAPKAAARASAFTLTGFALGTARNARAIIHSQFTLRNKPFIDKSLQTVFAKPNQPMNTMKAVTGSVTRPRYTGLAEQELGTPPKRTRTFTRAARGGVRTRAVRGWARLKPNAKYPSPTNSSLLTSARSGRKDFSLKGLTGINRIVGFLHMLSEQKKAQTFIIRKRFGRFKRGLYRFDKGKIKLLQSFDQKRKPKRIRWLTGGLSKYFKTTNISKVWNINLQKEWNKLRL